MNVVSAFKWRYLGNFKLLKRKSEREENEALQGTESRVEYFLESEFSVPRYTPTVF
jgi:hypothetical protein